MGLAKTKPGIGIAFEGSMSVTLKKRQVKNLQIHDTDTDTMKEKDFSCTS